MPERPHRIAFRVDSGVRIGSGHLARCLTLAHELSLRGAEVWFVCRELEGHAIQAIEHAEHLVVRLDAPSRGGPGGGTVSDWLQVAESQDAEETRAALARLQPDLLIVDHYGIGAEWEKAQRGTVESIFVIDDLANRAHECDVLLDQNYAGLATGERYQGLVPADCRLLLGPRFALLRPEYAIVRRILVARRAIAKRVFVFCGASDPTDETSKILETLSSEEFRHLAVDVVLGANHPAPAAVERIVAGREGTTLHRDLRSLAGLMVRADLGIGAGGTTTWERLCLKLPSVVVTIAENQELAAARLAADEIVVWAGRAPAVSAAEIAVAIRTALSREWSGRWLVDGHGLQRVMAVLLPAVGVDLRLERADVGDCELLFDWRNEPETRAMSFDTGSLEWATHVSWFEAQLRDPRVEILVARLGELPVGQVRLDSREGETVLSYGVDPIVRRRGLGRELVAGAMRRVSRLRRGRLRAHVKGENLASRRIFEQLGWKLHASEEAFVYGWERGTASEGAP